MRLNESDRRGSALVLVLMVTMLLGLLAFTTAGIATNGSEASQAERHRADLTYRCEAAAEALRLEVVNHYEQSGLPASFWLRTLAQDFDPAQPAATWPAGPPPGSPAAGARSWAAWSGVRAWIDRVEPLYGWIEVVGATQPEIGQLAQDRRSPTSVRLRLNIGTNEIFDLAFLTVTTNCMFCHLDIHGDVGSIGFFRPGWGHENGDGRGSGQGRIEGHVYVGDRASDDADTDWRDDVLQDPTNVNGTTVTGDLFEGYRGPKLPDDTIGNDGVPDFPSFDPDDARQRAASGGGSIWAGAAATSQPFAPDTPGVWVVPLGSRWDTGGGPGSGAIPLDRASMNGVIEGNLVVVGTPGQPIELDGNVFVSGDVVIKGAVTNQGAIYAGRNIYVAGDVTYTRQPSSGFPLMDDAQGLQAAGEEVDELRLAARGNVVVGDWTYQEPDGSIERLRDRQGQDFMNAQFELGRVRHYEASSDGSVTANELTFSPATGQYFDDLGREVPPDRVATVDGTTRVGDLSPVLKDRYDAALAPGNVVRDPGTGKGSFVPWMEQQEFRDVQGTERLEVITYRLPTTNDPAVRAFELGPEWTAAHGTNSFDRFDRDLLAGGENGMYVRDLGWAWKVAETAANPGAGQGVEWQRQVRHIDAFVYANKRIAGKVDEGHITINGGMAAREIGLLAPGVRNEFISNSRNSGDPIPGWVFQRFSATHPGHPRNAYGDSTADSRLYYDYRLRNGGFGFDFLARAGDLRLYRRGGEAAPPF